MIKNIKINNSTKKIKINKEDRFLGVKGENKYETLKFTFEDNFLDGEGILEIQKPNSQKEYIILEKEEDCYLLEVKNSLLNFEGEIIMQLVVRMTDNRVFKSVEFSMQVLKAIEATTEIPDEYETWDSALAAKIIEIDNKIDEVTELEEDLEGKVQSGYFKGEKGDKGDKGNDGTSPTVTTETISTGVLVTIIDINGSHTFTILNGKDGEIDEEVVKEAVIEYLNEHSIVVPTKTSDLTNDSDFVSDSNYVHTDNNYKNQDKQKLEGLNNYDDTEIKQAIQNKVEKVQGKSLIADTEIERLSTVTNYDDTEVQQKITNLTNNKANRNEIPDTSSFITKSVNDLVNYYLKNDTYTKTEVNNLIGQISTVSISVVQNLPETAQTNVIYFVPKVGTTGDVYNEYIYVNNAWELIGRTEVDLIGYATESWVNIQIANFLTQTQIETLISNSLIGYARTQDIPTNLSDLSEDATHRLVTDAEKTTWNGKANMSDIPDTSSFITNTVNNLINYYSKEVIDTALDSYINDIATLIGGDA